MTSILVFGANGQLGIELCSALNNKNIQSFEKNKLDITNKELVGDLLSSYKQSIIINASAFTKVDLAETEREKCYEVNAKSLEFLAKHSNQNRCTLIHFSTDYVFSGDGKTPYLEESPCKPINFYGFSKREGEKIILKNLSQSYILRTSWVYGKNGNNFPKSIIKMLKEREELNVVNDQTGVPTSTKFLSNIVEEISERVINQNQPEYGIYNAVPSGKTTWFEFAEYILNKMKKHNEIITKKINPVDSSFFKTAAKRPQYSCLSNSKLAKALKINIRHWNEYFDEFLTEL